MKKILSITIILIILIPNFIQSQDIHSKHFFYGYPKRIPFENKIIIRDLYIASYDPNTKNSDWVAYVVDKDYIGKSKKITLTEEFFLYEDERLELDDFRDAFSTLDYDKGHLIPVRSFSKSRHFKANLSPLTVISPQKMTLNRGILRKLDEKVDNFASKMDINVYVISGTLYLEDITPLLAADEGHKVPSHFYKIISFRSSEVGIKVFALKFPQLIEPKTELSEYLCTVDELEYMTGYNFFWQMYDTYENQVEAQIDQQGFEYFLKAQHIK